MNFRDLCQAYVKELGIAGGAGPSTVENQTGEFGNVVRWIADSELWMNTLWTDWNFLWAEYDGTQSGQSISLADAKTIHRSSVYLDFGTALSRPLKFIEWSEMRQKRAAPPMTGKPVDFSIDPSGKLWLDRPVSNQAVHFEYWRRPALMVHNEDTPAMPVDFHRIILARAAIMYGNREAAPEIISGFEAEYTDLLEKLQSAELEAFRNERMAGQDDPLYLRGP